MIPITILTDRGGATEIFIWKEGTQVTAGDFINGPQHGERYTFGSMLSVILE